MTVDNGTIKTKKMSDRIIDQLDSDPEKESKQAAVKQWLSRIAEDKARWCDDFERMEQDTEFAFGLQRPEQGKLQHDEYTANVTLRNINQKVASLYAKNPTAEFQRRKRRDFQIWDEKMETLIPLVQKLTMGIPPSFPEMALMMDYTHGMQFRQQVDAVADTLCKAYQYQLDEHDPDFKSLMKSLVRRTCICGVGYAYISFARDVESVLSSDGLDNTTMDRLRRLRAALMSWEDDGEADTSPRVEQLKSLMSSLMLSASGRETNFQVNERLVFDFPPATAVIPDKNCRNLRGFIGARYVTIERTLPLEDINAFFETNIVLGGDVKVVTKPIEGGWNKDAPQSVPDDKAMKPLVTLYEVLNKTDKTRFFLCDGYKDYVQEPEPVEPAVRGFWPIFALTFNDVEYIPNTRSSIFPPSDVTAMRSAQKEYNRTRESLRRHRNANAPKYVTVAGWLTDGDKDKLEFSEENAVIELQGTPPNGDVAKALMPITHDNLLPGDPRYDTSPLMMDILLTVGAQEANIGPPNPRGTATGQSIAEQSRSVGISSNIDDLDDFLSVLAAAGGDLWLQAASDETNKHIVGPGAVTPPPQARTDFLNEIFLRVVAASSGKPNKALELQNWQLIAPLLMQAGANPQFLVRETIKRVDDRLDPAEAFPLVPPTQGPPPSDGNAPQGQRPSHETGQEPPGQRRPGPGRVGRRVQGGGPQPQQQPPMVANAPGQ
jgi:hypothetical protein